MRISATRLSGLDTRSRQRRARKQGASATASTRTPRYQNEFVFVEEWESNEALQRHSRPPISGEFMQAIPATLVAPPDVKFHTFAATMDLSEIRTG